MKTKLKNQFALKRGSYNLVLIAVVLAVVIAINVLITMLAQRYPMQIDLTATGQNTLTEDNIAFITEVDREVGIIMCAEEAGYTGSEMADFAYNYYGVYPDQTATNYYKQTDTLLSSYSKYNSKISFKYVSPDGASFQSVKELVPDSTLYYGDIVVYSETADGRKNTKVLSYSDIYNLADNGVSYGGYYNVTGSNLESAVTGAISTVLIDDIKNVVYLSAHSTEGMFDYLKANLGNNGFKITEISDKVVTKIPENTDVVIMAGPESDLTTEELKVLDKYLDNNGKKGKNLFVFLSALDNTPNLNEFLAEWGIECEEGSTLYETDPENCAYQGGQSYYTVPYVFNSGSDYTAEMNKENALFLSMYNVPMKTAYTTFGNRAATVVLNTSDTVVSVPWSAEIPDTQKPSSEYKKGAYAAAIMTSETVYGENETLVSNVCAFSSANFINGNWDAYYGCSNLSLTMSVIKNVTGQEAPELYFISKAVPTYQFIASPTKGETNAVTWMFMVILPVAVLAGGIFVWIRRKSR